MLNLFVSPTKTPAGLAAGFYPEQTCVAATALEKFFTRFTGVVTTPVRNMAVRQQRILKEIYSQGKKLELLDREEINTITFDLRTKLRKEGLKKELILKSFALIREISARTVSMKHFDVQLFGGWAMIHGCLAEMETGEGKTLTATLAAATAALAGMPVHIITSNDYLVSRDCKQMAPVYQALGLSVGAVTQKMDSPDRQAAYKNDIVYCTNKQITFDYLRDRLVLGNDSGRLKLRLEGLHRKNNRMKRLFLPGLYFAIIDEADSVLVDEARTPLIISRPSDTRLEQDLYGTALEIAETLQEGEEYLLDREGHQVQFMEGGAEQISVLCKDLGPSWQGTRRSQELIAQAIKAQQLYIKDRHYLVSDEKIAIIDENTGRVMADRSWEKGLHQMIEVKEGCPLSGRRESLARITYQRFFRRYLMLAGMTGTAREISSELLSVYGLHVQKIPTNRPLKRRCRGQALYRDRASKWQAVAGRIAAVQKKGRPVLVGTRSVADSEQLSLLLTEKKMEHQVLNARQDQNEADIIACAGEAGKITIATNMAGRGTDIPLGKGVAEAGGLHVIVTEKNDSARIDRQLLGRCGRQGDPGSYEFILSLDDELLSQRAFLPVQLQRFFYAAPGVSKRLGLSVINKAQRATEKHHYHVRRDLLELDEQLGRTLAFTGKLE